MKYYLTALIIFFINNAFAQQFKSPQKLTATNRVTQHYYGFSCGISGGNAIVGAKWDNVDVAGNNSVSPAGSVYILTNNSGTWSQQKFVASDRWLYYADVVNGASLGASVSINENYAVAGAPTEDYDSLQQNQLINPGAAYIYEKDGGGVWSEVQKINASDRAQTDWFGNSVSISGNYLIVGAYNQDTDEGGLNTKNNSGAAYVFERNVNGRWVEVAKLVASDRMADDLFGWDVAIDDNGYAVVAAYAQDYDSNGLNLLTGAGAAYVFKRDAGGTWSQIQKLVSPERENSGRFAMSVDIENEKIVVGADLENELPKMTCGSAYLFEWSGVNFEYSNKFISNDLRDGDSFGRSVSVSGDFIICGANLQDYDANNLNMISNAGAVYVFKKQANGSWLQIDKVTANDRGSGDLFGMNTDISSEVETNILVGVYFEDEDINGTNTLSDAGSAYIFNYCTPTASTINLNACDSMISPSGNYIWNLSGVYNDTILNYKNCDSVITVNLNIVNASDSSLIVSACEYYVFSGDTLYNSGMYADIISLIPGCDSIVNLNLTILNSSSSIVNLTVCDSVDFFGTIYYQSGIHFNTFTNHLGCDSVVQTNFTILYSNDSTLYFTSCDSLEINGLWYYSSGSYSQTITNNYGCDSVLNLNVIINASSDSIVTVLTCELPYVWQGNSYFTSDVFQINYSDINGCDSTLWLDLTIQEVEDSTIYLSTCNSYTWFGNNLTESGLYSQTLSSTLGCDSTVFLNLDLLKSSDTTLYVNTCDYYEWNGVGYFESEFLSKTIIGTNGCDSTIYLDLTIRHFADTYFVMLACQEAVILGTTYNTSDYYILYGTNVEGCDSVIDVELLLYNPTDTSLYFTSCDSFIYNGNVLDTSGIFHFNLTGMGGCDSLVTLHLTLNHSNDSTIFVSTCDWYNWNGNDYYESGIYSVTLQGVFGCDSTVYLDLMIKNYSDTFFVSSVCDSISIFGQSIYESGYYILQGINSVGCDSIIDVDLTIYNSNDTVITITECSGYVFNGNLIDSSGVYLFNATNSSGCDSSIVLDATIIQKPNAGKDSLYSYCANGDEVFDMNLFLEFGTDLSGIWIDIDTTGLLDLSIFNSSGADFGTWNFAYVLSDLNCNSDTAIVQLDIMYCLSIGQVYSTQIKISPNPATDFVDITSPFSGKIFIIDILGKTVYESEIKASAHINTKDFSKGVYTVLIKNPEQSIIGKLVVE